MSSADHRVIERVRDGDTEAFSDLVARYQKAVFGIAVSTTADVDEAEDLAQTSLIEAFARLGELRNGSRFGPWLYAIARNRCRDWLRARSRLPAPASDPSGLPAAGAPGLPTTSEWDALRPSWTDGVTAALASLPQDYRAVLLLRYVADLSYEEIGQALSLSASAARVRCHRGRSMMREQACRQTEDLISRRLDGQLSDDELEQLEQHLRVCPDCRDRWQGTQQLIRDLREAFQPSPQLAERVMSVLRSAVSLTRRAALEGDGKTQERFARLGEEAAERAEALADAAPELYLLLANEYHQHRHNWAAAERAYRKAVELDPARAAPAVLDAATRAQVSGGESAGLRLLAIVLELEPELLGVDAWQGALFWLTHRTYVARTSGELEQALGSLMAPAESVEDDSLVRAAAATVHLRAGNVAQAVRELEAASSGFAADVPQFWEIRAEALDAAGRRQEAVAAALKAMETSPGDKGGRYCSRTVLAKHAPSVGAEAVQKRIAEGVQHPTWFMNLGTMRWMAGDIDGAQRAYEEFARRDPSHGEHYLAAFYLQERRLDKAEAASRRHVKACGPGHFYRAPSLIGLARVLGAKGEWDSAATHACLALQDLPQSHLHQRAPVIWRGLQVIGRALDEGLSSARVAEAQDAVVFALRAIAGDLIVELPLHVESDLLHMVRGLGSIGKPQGQAEYWSSVLSLGGRSPTVVKARIVAARALASVDPTRARDHFEKLVTDDPTDELAQLGLWAATVDVDAEAAITAAVAAVACAHPDSDRHQYEQLAQFLARTDPEKGLRAFAAGLEPCGGPTGPLALGYLRLLAAGNEWERLPGVVDAILEGEDDALADKVARVLSEHAKHREASALMEHAVRLDPLGLRRPYHALEVFAAAGDEVRAHALYEQLAAQRPEDAWMAFAAHTVYWESGDRKSSRHWLERTWRLDDWNPWFALGWARWHQGCGDLATARDFYGRPCWPPAGADNVDPAGFHKDVVVTDPEAKRVEGLKRIDALGESLSPVNTVCSWLREDVSDELAGEAAEAALVAGDEGRAWIGVAAALKTLAVQRPEDVLEWAQRAAEEYPDNLGAQVGLAVIATGLETEGLEDPAAAARAALAAVDGVDPALAPAVHVVCGEILLHEDERDEAAHAFREAGEAPSVTPEWKARAEGGLQRACDRGGEPEEEG